MRSRVLSAIFFGALRGSGYGPGVSSGAGAGTCSGFSGVFGGSCGVCGRGFAGLCTGGTREGSGVLGMRGIGLSVNEYYTIKSVKLVFTLSCLP